MVRWLKYMMLIPLLVAVGCSTTRHLPEGALLLDHVNIKVEGDSVKSTELVNYLRQTPNNRALGFMRLQLAMYNLSGRDTTKWYNRWVRRMGQPPVAWSAELTDASVNQLHQALVNRGYMGATVVADSVINRDKRKVDITYRVATGAPHRVSTIDYDIPDSAIATIILRDTLTFPVRAGALFDRNHLDTERAIITERLRNAGYYAFNKEYITFVADTAEGSLDVNLTMRVNAPRLRAGAASRLDSIAVATRHDTYYLRRVVIVTDYRGGPVPGDATASATDSVEAGGITVLYGPDRYIRASTLEEKCYLVPGALYTARNVDRTYEAMSRLGILKSVNIDFVPAGGTGSMKFLDAYVLLTRNRKQSVTLDVEGTNSEGDLGFGVGVTYQHRNVGHRSQLLTARLRVNYESLSGNFNGLINDRYSEYAAEVGITFPRFEFPFASARMRKRLNVATEFSLSMNYQERPEYTRIIGGGAWKYKWGNRDNTLRHTFSLLDINYVYLPERTVDFLDQIAPDNPLLRYSYEDHFIVSMSYNLFLTNKRIPSALSTVHTLQPRVYTLRANVETAGNVLYALSSAFGHRDAEGMYTLFGIRYSQYVKGEVDYSVTLNLSRRHALAFHVGGGIGVPYGNSTVLPFEKRFYAGGANGVRGWSVRTLGPGSFDGRNSVTDFINQCGDIRLDMSAEYRAKLFWVLEGAAFVDAGNIWTIRDYENQPGGVWRWNEFYKQIALAYGLGLRLDFSYFLLRFDLGMKAHNPAKGQEPWPLIHPRWKRDATFHFAVGYPF